MGGNAPFTKLDHNNVAHTLIGHGIEHPTKSCYTALIYFLTNLSLLKHRLLASESSWLDEAVLPEDSPLRTPESKSWSPENGGCEGINYDGNDKNDGSSGTKGLLVPSNEINIQMNVYNKYHSTFPYVETGEDESRLIQRVDVIQVVG